jgi:TorA maturation chaperone TorD
MTQSQQQWHYLQPALAIRIFAYDFLRRTFLHEPAASYLETVAAAGFIEHFPFAGENKAIRQGVHEVQDYLQTNNATDAKTYSQLHWDYTRLFIGPYQLPAPLWESAYVSEKRLLFQESTFHVRCEYAQYGFLAPNHHKEADDHLGLELDFMYQLACLASEKGHEQPAAVREILSTSQLFLTNHLLSWVPALARDIRQHASTGFYRGMASLLTGYLALDDQILGELLSNEVFCDQPPACGGLAVNP